MFTGLVQQVGVLTASRSSSQGKILSIAIRQTWPDLQLGESIAVEGTCLTVRSFAQGFGSFDVDVSPESLSRTTLGQLNPGNPVNLERALRISDRLGGHLVLGHVDCTARLANVASSGAFREYDFHLPAEHLRYVASKGSITVSGVSLTVAAVSGFGFSVALIPATLEATTLGSLGIGSRVNIEFDVIMRYVERLISKQGTTTESPSNESIYNKLLDNGFITPG